MNSTKKDTQAYAPGVRFISKYDVWRCQSARRTILPSAPGTKSIGP
jgi:hypothetical protein